jgi:hypothetical protein
MASYAVTAAQTGQNTQAAEALSRLVSGDFHHRGHLPRCERGRCPRSGTGSGGGLAAGGGGFAWAVFQETAQAGALVFRAERGKDTIAGMVVPQTWPTAAPEPAQTTDYR